MLMDNIKEELAQDLTDIYMGRRQEMKRHMKAILILPSQ